MNTEQLKHLEVRLWDSADTLRANSGLKSSEYATPILGLIFLKFADNKYRKVEAKIQKEYEAGRNSRAARDLSEIAIEKCGFYLPDEARYDYLLNLPEGKDIAAPIKEAMIAVEKYVPFLAGALPKDEYHNIGGKDSSVLKRLLQNFSNIPADAEGDLFGQIYEYFLGKFALAEGQGGGEFFTPRSVVRLMVEVIEPHRGRVFDPACGSGGMFVQSARFIAERRNGGTEDVDDLFVCGQEKTEATVKLAKMNLAVNGLRGEIYTVNSYSQDPFHSFGKFDYVLANPPFNVDNVDVDTVIRDPRFTTYGVPRNKSKPSGMAKGSDGKPKNKETVPNGNYLWISLFATSLKEGGRAALVMANSASDAQHTEADIRQRLIEANLIYGMLTLPSNMFYTVTLPATLWFFEKGKHDDRILFIDARNVFTQIDRAHREFSDDQLQNIAVISHLHRGERHRFLERVGACLVEGKERLERCRKEYPCIRQTLEEALPIKAAGSAPADEDPVAGAARGISRLVEPLGLLWDKKNDALHDLCARCMGELAQPLLPGMSETEIARQNQDQQELTRLFSNTMAILQGYMKVMGDALRDYEKALGEKAEREGKRRPQDRKLRDAKAEWDRFAASVNAAGEPFAHAGWLQERFPDARYADVVGLCKLATKEEVAEQGYSLNPGRYVGVVIEDDGKTAEQFRVDLLTLNTELEKLNAEAAALVGVISHNVHQMVGGG